MILSYSTYSTLSVIFGKIENGEKAGGSDDGSVSENNHCDDESKKKFLKCRNPT